MVRLFDNWSQQRMGDAVKQGEPLNLDGVPVVNLADAPGEREAWDRPRALVYFWAICELLFVTNAWQISSGLRIWVLRKFGADIGSGVVFRPRTRVKLPWKLHIGDRSWIGEGVWFHNQDHIHLEHDVVVSQDTFLTTGSHRHRQDMALVTRPIHIAAGAWITSRCVILGGSVIGQSALVTPGTCVAGSDVPSNAIFGAAPGEVRGRRFPDREQT
ncbi:putative colanic acid biosynthesis acetyltransferase WcaF [Okibacterium sp. HSC-33S16]|nr:putative colanic acid biosynthesis acetyltransferase WcaF [Okibacterium sp. HSC-33S16]